MRKGSVLWRFILFVPLYTVIFLALAWVQFSMGGSFTEKAGALEITGHIRQHDVKSAASGKTEGEAAGAEAAERELPLEGDVSVLFRGLLFSLSEGTPSLLCLVDGAGERRALSPEIAIIGESSARFKLGGGNEILFYTRGETGNEELVVSAVIADEGATLELPFSAQYEARLTDDNGMSAPRVLVKNEPWSFDGAVVDFGRRRILFSVAHPALSFHITPDKPSQNLLEFVLSGAMEPTQYIDALNQWITKAAAEWQREIRGNKVSEGLISSTIAEAARHGADAYSAAVSSVPSSWRDAERRSFVSAPFLGRLAPALSSLSAYEARRQREIAALFNAAPDAGVSAGGTRREARIHAFFAEKHLVEFLAVRGFDGALDQAAAFAGGIDGLSIETEDWAAVFELWRDWFIWKQNENNPFAPLAASLCGEIPRHLRKGSGSRLLFFFPLEKTDDEAEAKNAAVLPPADVAYNVRLGAALVSYGEFMGNREWAAIGRSLVLSALSLGDEEGGVPSRVSLSRDGSMSSAGEKIDALSVYELLSPSPYYPHAAALNIPGKNIWLWTASPAVSGTLHGAVLDITVNFIPSATHYLLIRGIGSFSKIQLRNRDYRTDPQFENYDAPGWAYSAAEQTLMIKLVHGVENELVKIYF